jgi:AraC family transcriptional regulator of arabinose operon
VRSVGAASHEVGLKFNKLSRRCYQLHQNCFVVDDQYAYKIGCFCVIRAGYQAQTVYKTAAFVSSRRRLKLISYWSPPSARREVLTVGGLGVASRMQGIFVDRPAGLDEFLFVHFHDDIQLEVHGERMLSPAGTVVIWPPHTPHYFGSSRTWEHSWVYADGSALKSLVASCGLPIEEPFHLNDISPTVRFLTSIHEELAGHPAPDPQILECHFTIWMRELARRTRSQLPNPASDQMLEIRRAIDNNPGAYYSLKKLSRMACLSVTHFSSKFRTQFGTSPMSYLLAVRMRRARYYLHDRNLNIAEVGRKVGFSDPYHFSKQFKRHFGVSPAHYRKRLRVSAD